MPGIVCPEIGQAWGGGDNWAELTGKGGCGALQWALLLSCHPDFLWAVLTPQLAQGIPWTCSTHKERGWRVIVRGDGDGVVQLGRTSWWAGHFWLSVVGKRAVNDFAEKTDAENMKLFWANKKSQSRLHESLPVMRDLAQSISVITSPEPGKLTKVLCGSHTKTSTCYLGASCARRDADLGWPYEPDAPRCLSLAFEWPHSKRRGGAGWVPVNAESLFPWR